MDPDGGGAVKLVQIYNLQENFDWSPDGSKIVYASGGLHVSDPSGQSALRITPEGEYASEPRWSPDGQWIAYTAYDASSSSIRLVSPDGQQRRTLLERGVDGLDWSPDSSRLSYVDGTAGNPASVYVLDIATGAETVVSVNDAFYSWTRWSPDGQRIAFRGWGGSIRVVSPDGTNEINLSQGLDYANYASWSPDGQRVVFDGAGELYVSDRDGGGRRLLTTGVTPDWSSDGSRIAFSRAADVFTISPDGSGEQQLTDEFLRDDRQPLWSPDMVRIAFEGTRVQVLCPSFPWPVEANVIGTPDDDLLRGTDGPDVIAGLEGNDTISGLGGDDVICGGDGDDTLIGDAGNDYLFGEWGADELHGQDGADELDGGKGPDSLSGGPGRDVVTYLYAPRALRVDLGRGSARGWGVDYIEGVEDAYGWIFDDVLIGDSGDNELYGSFPYGYDSGDDLLIGHRGNDELKGFDGSDDLRGGRGRDHLDGGRGKDTCSSGPGSDVTRSC